TKFNAVVTNIPPTGACLGDFRYNGNAPVFGNYDNIDPLGEPNPVESLDWRPGFGAFSAAAIADGQHSGFERNGYNFRTGICTAVNVVNGNSVPYVVLQCLNGAPSNVVL